MTAERPAVADDVAATITDQSGGRVPPARPGLSQATCVSSGTTDPAVGREDQGDGAGPLHSSHRWGQRPVWERDEPGSNRFRERRIPCCMNCLVDGYEDEYDAFQPCRRQGARRG